MRGGAVLLHVFGTVSFVLLGDARGSGPVNEHFGLNVRF
jgi:hypothetical protein